MPRATVITILQRVKLHLYTLLGHLDIIRVRVMFELIMHNQNTLFRHVLKADMSPRAFVGLPRCHLSSFEYEFQMALANRKLNAGGFLIVNGF